jgi:hypothetical protein
MTAIQYFSYAMMGLPYMGVGRNLAYRKDLFFNNSGFKNHIKLMSGDDDLFINEVANARNTAICFTKESIMISEPKKTFKDWILQKRRHIGTAKYYKSIHKILLTIFYISQLFFWVLAVICLFSGDYWQWAAVCISLRFLIQWSCIGFSARKLDEMDLIYLAPVLELFLISTQLFIFSANLISKPKYWK